MKSQLFLLLALTALPAIAGDLWGIQELETAQKAAVAAFEEQGGTIESVSGFSIKRTSQGNAARAEVYYTDAAGASATVRLFCHVHGTEIDCH